MGLMTLVVTPFPLSPPSSPVYSLAAHSKFHAHTHTVSHTHTHTYMHATATVTRMLHTDLTHTATGVVNSNSELSVTEHTGRVQSENLERRYGSIYCCCPPALDNLCPGASALLVVRRSKINSVGIIYIIQEAHTLCGIPFCAYMQQH